MMLSRSVILTFSALLFALAGQSQQTDVYSQLWKISGKGLPGPSYLLGTDHVVGGSFVDSFPAIRQAFDRAGVLVREALPDATGAPLPAVLEFPPGDSLQRYMSPAHYMLVTDFIRSKLSGEDTLLMARVPRLTPQAVNFLITELKGEEASGNAAPGEAGIDDYLYAQAQAQGKRIVALETLEDQARAIETSADLRKQAAQLVSRVAGGTGAADDARQLESSATYRSRKIPYYFSYRQTQRFERAYGAERNIRWMEKLPRIISKEPVFITVGNDHLISSEGLIMLLRKAGYKVTNVPL